MNMMKAWRAESFGEPRDVLAIQHVEVPEPPEGCVAVRVRASGVGLPDLLMTRGSYPIVKQPPVSPGQEVVGDIVAVGRGVAARVGDRVMGLTMFMEKSGGFAEYCLLTEKRTWTVPSGLSDQEAAGFVIPFTTAYVALVMRGALMAGETLLVLGGAGSSGAAAIQLGKCLGAKVIAVAGSADKLDFCTALGADHVVSYQSGDLAEAVMSITDGRGADVIFDPVGGKSAATAVKAIARYGRFTLVGFASGTWAQIDPLDMVLRNYSTVGIFAGGLTHQEYQKVRADLGLWVDQGLIRTPVSRVFTFDEVPEALRVLDVGPPAGKMVVMGTG